MLKWLTRSDPKHPPPKKRHSRRHYKAAAVNRLTAGWATQTLSADAAIRRDLRVLRARSRELAVNNDYVRKFLGMCRANIVGAQGITLQMRVVASEGEDGEIVYNEDANRQIETAWKNWGRKGMCTVDGRLSWIQVQQMVAESVARDGEVLLRFIHGRDAGNDFGFALQVLEADHLDETLSKELQGGRYIRMGVEYNRWDRPVAYHLFRFHPGDEMHARRGGDRYIRVPASQILHIYNPERPSQSRGVPWPVSAMTRMNMLGGYEEAEVTAARVASSKMGFYTTPDGVPPYTGDKDEAVPGEPDEDEGDYVDEAEPGVFQVLPKGAEFTAFDPNHPGGNFAPFLKSMLRGAAVGMGVSYNALAADLEGVNYSSIRQGALEERDHWRVLQRWLIDALCTPVFEAWLKMSLGSETLPLPPSGFDRFNVPVWRPRGWQWVDPAKEVKANREAIEAGLKSEQDVAGEQGRDIEDVYAEQAAAARLRERYGINVTPMRPQKEDEDSNTGKPDDEDKDATGKDD